MRDAIRRSVSEAVRAVETLNNDKALTFMERVASLLADTYSRGRKLLVAGNGGSLCDAMHFAEELTGFFRNDRPPLPAIALADPGHLSCVANDRSYEEVFARGVRAYGKEGDLFVALTTSGHSENLIRAAKEAEKLKMHTVAFLGKRGGRMRGMCDEEWIVPGPVTSERIQEVHMTAIHIIIEMTESLLTAQSARPDLEVTPETVHV
ncbi:MAG: SIS domain-containing protein [Simkaniaceae bacterium]|nr:SIS domain-containing protein [Simkaniaceae bacterium]